MRVVGVNRTRHRGIGRRYGSGGGRVAGEGGWWRWRHVGGARGKEEEEEEAAGDRHGGSWYRGWRWRWQSQCPSARTGSRRVAVNDPRQLLFAQSEQESETRSGRRAGGGGKGAAPGGRVEGAKRVEENERVGGGGRPTREEARGGRGGGGGGGGEEEDSRWKADGRTSHRKGENEMKSVFSGSSSRARANASEGTRAGTLGAL